MLKLLHIDGHYIAPIFWSHLKSLVVPCRAIIAILSLRYPISRDTFQGRVALPQNGAIPPLAITFTQAHLCDTPFCNVSRDTCVIPHEEFCDIIATYRAILVRYPMKSFVILSLQVSRDMKSIAAGPLCSRVPVFPSTSLRFRSSNLTLQHAMHASNLHGVKVTIFC